MARTPAARPGVRVVLAIAVVAAVMESVYGSLVAPLLPRFVEDYGLGATGAGAFVAAYGAGMVVGALAAGAVAQRAGLRGALVAAALVTAAATAWFGIASSVPELLAARALQGASGAVAWTAGLAWLVSVAPPERRGRYVGVVSAATLLGSILGPSAGVLAAEVSFPATFGVAAALCVALAGVAGLQAAPLPSSSPPQSLLAAIRTGAGDASYVTAAQMCLALVLLLGAFGVLTPLKLDALGASTAGIAGVFVVAALVESGASALWGDLSDRYGRLRPMLAGMAVLVLLTAALGFSTGLLIFCGAVVLLGPAQAAVIAPGTALAADAAERAGVEQAQNFALINLLWAVGGLGGSLLGGVLADLFSVRASYLVVAGATLALVVLVARRARSLPGFLAVDAGGTGERQ